MLRSNCANSSFGFVFLSFVFLLCFMSLLRPGSTISTAILGNETDRLSLLKLKDSIPGDPRGLLGSWNESVHFCEWLGVECGLRHQRVRSLDLEGYNLQGTISPHIGNLSFLRIINLRNNSFSGEIPQQVGHLFRLRQLNLSFNMLEGNIPLNLTYCSQLRVLNLRRNKLVGKIPTKIGSLSDLRLLSFAQNNLTGGIPPSLGNISSLQNFELSNNKLDGDVPIELGRLKRLTFFGIALNNLSGTIPLSIYNVSSLQSFVISFNRLEGTIPSTIGSTLPNLITFLSDQNQLSGTIPESFSNTSQLEMLSLAENNFVGSVPKNLGNLQNFFHLNLLYNNLGNYSANSWDFIPSLTNCTALEVLALSRNNLGGVLPKSVANLSTNLVQLNLGGNEISGNIPTTLENLVNLEIIGLENNQFTGNIPSSLGKLQNLHVLSLIMNGLSGRIPSSTGNLSKVFVVSLSDNKLEGGIPQDIAKCQNIQYINIANNKLSGTIPTGILGLSSLIYLNFSSNRLSGSLPVEMGKLKNLNQFDLSQNKLTGNIPEAIRGCESIEYVDLHGNLFRGILPSTIASLRGLEYLDLSSNNLTGNIPKDLERLRFLTHLNLSFNHLEGEVPSKGVFQNTSALSVAGNADLCGGIPNLKLPRCANKEIIGGGKTSGLKLPIIIVFVVVTFLLLSGFIFTYWRRSTKNILSPTVSTIGFLSKVSYSVLYKATNEFSPTMLIGVGSFSSVYKGILDEDDNPIAVKVLNLQKKGAEKSFIAECKALRTIRHRNLAKVLTCCSSTDYNGNDFKALVFEYMSNGSLDKWLHLATNGEENRSQCLSLIRRVNIAIDVAYAINYLHVDCDQPIIHCDLKPSNVLLDNEMIAHVSDFGLARLISNNNGFFDGQTSTSGMKGTVGYVAPEYATGSEPSKQGDTYSFGILLLEMFTGRRPTDEIFKDDFNLHNFVKTALPERLVHVLDSTLLPERELEQTAMNDDSDDGQIDKELGNVNSANSKEKEISAHLRKCFVSMLEIGLSCSQESPNQRMSIGQVITELQRIKTAYESVEIQISVIGA